MPHRFAIFAIWQAGRSVDPTSKGWSQAMLNFDFDVKLFLSRILRNIHPEVQLWLKTFVLRTQFLIWACAWYVPLFIASVVLSAFFCGLILEKTLYPRLSVPETDIHLTIYTIIFFAYFLNNEKLKRFLNKTKPQGRWFDIHFPGHDDRHGWSGPKAEGDRLTQRASTSR